VSTGFSTGVNMVQQCLRVSQLGSIVPTGFSTWFNCVCWFLNWVLNISTGFKTLFNYVNWFLSTGFKLIQLCLLVHMSTGFSTRFQHLNWFQDLVQLCQLVSLNWFQVDSTVFVGSTMSTGFTQLVSSCFNCVCWFNYVNWFLN
jgi:hypothetical protein